MRPLPKLMIVLSAVFIASSASAQSRGADQPIAAEARTKVIKTLAAELKRLYVFPATADQIAKSLTKKLAADGYADAATTRNFAEALTKDLRDVGKDRHFFVGFAPDFTLSPPDNQALTPQQSAEERHETMRSGSDIRSVQRLPGNVGYLDIRGFGRTEFVAPAYEAAMQLLAGTDALIIDLRRNGGGDPQSVAELASHLFPEGNVRHLNDIYSRTDGSTRAFWTNPAVGTRYDRTVLVLTSNRTFSGGEEFAYDLKTQKRATLIGEPTGGGANPGEVVKLAEGFIAFIPSGRAINPITKTNWEYVGVAPDIAASAMEAMKVAYLRALDDIIAKSTVADERAALQKIRMNVEAGTMQLPDYASPAGGK